MGNSLGGKKSAKVMKINGETIKWKTPVQAGEVVKDYPGHVLLDSEVVKHFGMRASPLESCQELKSKRLYFLVELPRIPEEKAARRVRSGINMSAKDRLESLMLSRRSVSDLSAMKSTSIAVGEAKEGVKRVKMRLPKAEVARLMMESKDETEAAERIVGLCLASKVEAGGGAPPQGSEGSLLRHQQLHWKSGHGHGRVVKKRVGFLPVSEGEIQLAS
ncbi:Protein of unknown function DUF4228, plant protein [Actinidia chinensis var. chinensis]|uniref:Uncharacterized protein n=1 Tax=Actinidia chinensis var. chinensis TaxID=1590841 RepID=A0A2R6PB18_ACTCC|nr:Protein of unknown function DUF4228, plant protein [Actinidia chinensis var. chinensis]